MYDQLCRDFNPWWENPAARAASRHLVRRSVQPQLVASVTSSDRRALVLVGPRQVGKTVLLKQSIDDLLAQQWPPGNITYFDFSDDRLVAVLKSPREVVDRRPPNCADNHPRAFFLDEVSRAQGWADWLKQTVDEGRHRVVVTDSAATLLRDGTRESGLGRWDELQIEGLTYREYLEFQARVPGESADQVEQRLPRRLEAFLFGGGFPEHVGNDSLDEIRRRLRADIADRAILKDLLGLGVDLQRVRDLFVYLMEDSGAIFDRDARSRALVRGGGDQPDKRSMEKWLEVLLDTHLVCRVDPFGHSASGRLGGRAKPKLYAVDQGLIVAFASTPTPVTDQKVRGQVTEAAVLRAIRSTLPERIAYERSTAEKDFVVDRAGRRTVIEVTANEDPRKKANEVRASLKKVHASHGLVVHSGLEADAGGTIVPLRRFLLNPTAYLESP